MPSLEGMAASSLDSWFDGKPEARATFDVLAAVIEGFGPSDVAVGSQISFGRRRKFAWFWLYNVTKKDPNGVPHLMLALDRPVDSDLVRSVEQIGKRRWNHQIVVRSDEVARSAELADLLEEAYGYGA